MSKITQLSRAVASLTNQPSLAMAQGLHLPTPRAAPPKSQLLKPWENVGRELGSQREAQAG